MSCLIYCHAECCYAERRNAECHRAIESTWLVERNMIVSLWGIVKQGSVLLVGNEPQELDRSCLQFQKARIFTAFAQMSHGTNIRSNVIQTNVVLHQKRFALVTPHHQGKVCHITSCLQLAILVPNNSSL